MPPMLSPAPPPMRARGPRARSAATCRRRRRLLLWAPASVGTICSQVCLASGQRASSLSGFLWRDECTRVACFCDCRSNRPASTAAAAGPDRVVEKRGHAAPKHAGLARVEGAVTSATSLDTPAPTACRDRGRAGTQYGRGLRGRGGGGGVGLSPAGPHRVHWSSYVLFGSWGGARVQAGGRLCCSPGILAGPARLRATAATAVLHAAQSESATAAPPWRACAAATCSVAAAWGLVTTDL
jgi:hypothetical protein